MFIRSLMKVTPIILCAIAVPWTAAVPAEVSRSFETAAYAESRRSVKAEFTPTDLLPDASGEARLRRSDEGVEIEASWKDLGSPDQYGPEWLVYVVWAVSDLGEIQNLGDIPLKNGRGEIEAVTPFTAFGLMVTAEPYFAVDRPSDLVVLRSTPSGKSGAELARSEAKVTLTPRDAHALGRTEAELALMLQADRRAPGELIQARNALEIARLSGADRFAAQALQEATARLVEAEDLQLRRASTSSVTEAARAAVQAAETARRTAVTRAEQARAEEERAAEIARRQEEERKKELEKERAEMQRRLEEEAAARADLERRLREQQEAAQRAVPAPGPAAPPRMEVPVAPAQGTPASGADLALEKTRLEAERERIQAERLVLEANKKAEQARLDAERAALNATVQAEIASRQQEQDAATRGEMDRLRREAEQVRLEAEEVRRTALLAAEEARREADRARLEAELRIREAEIAALQRQAQAPPQPTAEEQARAAQERAALEAELAAQRDALDLERRTLMEEQTRTTSALELERSQLERDRARLDAEMARQAADLAAERTALERAREDAAKADEQRRLAEQQQAEAVKRLEEERRRLEEERAAIAAERERAQVEIQQAQVDAERARREEDARRVAERRERLLGQLTTVLEATDTERGLLINMSDVSFPPGQHELRLEARETLARVAGILLAYPSLEVTIEGHTDSTGSQSGNQILSERRAAAVRDYLVSQGVPPTAITSAGFGDSRPVADNATSEGRKKNRRVEMIVSGAAIGTGTALTQN